MLNTDDTYTPGGADKREGGYIQIYTDRTFRVSCERSRLADIAFKFSCDHFRSYEKCSRLAVSVLVYLNAFSFG